MRPLIKIFFKGCAMGTADIIPGVSGGTVALILGIYTRLINNIATISPKHFIRFLQHSPGLLKKGKDREKLKEVAHEVDLPFFVALLLGIVVAGGILSNIIPPLIDAFPNQVNAFFLGLVSVSIYYPLKEIKTKNLFHFLFVFIGTAIAYFTTSQFFQVGLDISPLSIFIMGMIAINAMILPGVSGAYILKSVGVYTPILEAIRNILRFNFLDSLPVILPFALGIVIGLTTFVRILRWVLSRYYDATMATLAGLMLGALHTLWPNFSNEGSFFNFGNIVTCSLIPIGASIILVLIAVEKSRKKEHNT